MKFKVWLLFSLTLYYLSFPLGSAAVLLLSWLPEWLLPQQSLSDNLYLAVQALLATLGFYLQWYVLLPRLLRWWKSSAIRQPESRLPFSGCPNTPKAA